jgi:hypothetical protein
MLFWIIKNIDAKYLFIISCFPIIGLLASYSSDKKILKIILAVSAILLPLKFSGYFIIYDGCYYLFFTVIISIAYSFLINWGMKKLKAIKSILLFIVLMTISYIIYWFDAFGGYDETLFTQRFNNYRIRCVRSNGFSGRSVKTYYLYYAPMGGLIYKSIQSVRTDPNDVPEKCVLKFEKAGIIYNSCSRKFRKR